MARVLVLCAVVVALTGALGGEFDRSARAQTHHAEALMVGSASVALPAPSHDFPTESLYVNSNLSKSRYGSFECATDSGHEYRWPCTRPGNWD
jgi:hypothetical protein